MTTASGLRRHLVTLENPGTPQPDQDGGYEDSPEALDPPAVYAQITTASAGTMARQIPNTIESGATHLVTMPYHAGVTTQTVLTFNGRRFSVTGVVNPDERNIETICTCVEIVP